MAKSGLLHLTVEDRKAAIDRLLEDSSPNASFFLQLAMATAIVVPGLMINNPAVIIGGMLVAPLLSPILSLALGVSLADFKLIRRALITIVFSAVLVVGAAVLMSLFNPARSLNSEILSRADASLAYLIIAVASGAAAAFAFARPNLSAALPGIAVSVALLPPLSAGGVALSLGALDVFIGAVSLFIVNLIGIVLASLVVFSLFGFYPVRKEAAVKLKEQEREIVVDTGDKKDGA